MLFLWPVPVLRADCLVWKVCIFPHWPNVRLPGQVVEDEVSDNSAECVVCLSDVRDTLILPCRHLCLCNTCADTLRYQANNCPICRLRKPLRVGAWGHGRGAGGGGEGAAGGGVTVPV